MPAKGDPISRVPGEGFAHGHRHLPVALNLSNRLPFSPRCDWCVCQSQTSVALLHSGLAWAVSKIPDSTVLSHATEVQNTGSSLKLHLGVDYAGE
jgi:hypothetical protein